MYNHPSVSQQDDPNPRTIGWLPNKLQMDTECWFKSKWFITWDGGECKVKRAQLYGKLLAFEKGCGTFMDSGHIIL